MFKQDIFWGNLPVKTTKLGGMFTQLFEHWYPENPFIIFTGTNKINFDKFPLTPKLVKKLKKLEIYLYEPLSLYEKGKQHNRGFFSEFKGGETLRADELDSIEEFSKRLNASITVYTCNYNVQKHITDYPFELKCFYIFLRNQFNGGSITVTNSIEKRFICPNWRYSNHRELIINHIKDTPGYYSWAFSDPPLSIDVKLKSINSDFKKWPEGNVSSPQGLHEYYLKSFCVVANETRFYEPTGNFSEKTNNAMIYKKPFICVAPPFTLEYIKKLGFKTFDKWWSEEYDTETNHDKRIQMIFDTLDSIKEKSIYDLQLILNDMQDVLDWNQNLANKIFKNKNIL